MYPARDGDIGIGENVMTTAAIGMSGQCAWCGGFHTQKCPLVKAIEYHENGTTKRVEFYRQTISRSDSNDDYGTSVRF